MPVPAAVDARENPDLADRILISRIEFHGHCGVTEEERRPGQRLSVDVEAALDLSAASRSDAVRDTVDYAAVSERVLEIGRNGKFALVETLAGRIAEDLLSRFPLLEEVTVRVRKCIPPVEAIQGTFEVEIRRLRKPS